MWKALRAHLLADWKEHLAFILTGYASMGREHILLARELIVIPDNDLEALEHSYGLSLRLNALLGAMNRANRSGQALVEAHSHPFATNQVGFSPIDRQGQRELAAYLADTLPERPYGVLVLGQNAVDGRVWFPPRKRSLLLTEVRVLGDNLLRLPTSGSSRRKEVNRLAASADELFHRQALAFGEVGQRKVQETTVGIAGLGGIGSVVAQQLAHLGIQRFVLVDHDRVERTNLHRLVGSTPTDVGRMKVEVTRHLILSVNPRAKVQALATNLRGTKAIKTLKGVDVLFGCVDNDAGRLILNELALAYLVPYIDCGAGIQVEAHRLKEAGGKVSVWTPGRPCLLCAKDLSPRIAAEELESEKEREFRQRHGYVAGAQVPEPAVISLNSAIASVAVTEFLALVAGLRPARQYTYYDMLEQRVGPRIVARDGRCTVCAVEGLGDLANVERIWSCRSAGGPPAALRAAQ
jgi:molybdopterin/thiamine biosynthesis adenylyltransferase